MRQQLTRPIATRKSVRRDDWRGLTSVKAGVINPIAFFPLLREDRIRGRMDIQVKMAEAVEVIINPITVSVAAYLVPKSAHARFDGSMETLNRSYQGEPMPGGAASPPWFVKETQPSATDKGHPIYDVLGVHYGPASYELNTDLVEAYNTVVNWRRRGVSKALAEYPVTDTALKPAFWNSPLFDHIKPSFDAAMMEGAVPVQVDAGAANVTDYAWKNAPEAGTGWTYLGGDGTTYPDPSQIQQMGIVSTLGFPKVQYSELAGSISLANIELARQSQAFAKMRERYAGLSDEYIIDLLMQGVRVPPEEFREPILVGRGSATMGQQERFATDGASLDISVANGMTRLSMSINTPAVNPGGMVLVTMEIVPEQLHERREDMALAYPAGGGSDKLPNYLRDFLDPQKVEVVPNSYADLMHADPSGIFGYAPLNHRWNRTFARVGGRYKRPVPDAFVEERQRIWQVESDNPTLSDDFYVCPSPFPHTPFADQDADPFEVIVVAPMEIVGNTVMGARFEEDENAYDKVIGEVDQTRIEGPATVETMPANPETATAEVQE